jgi:hypothetical protein
MLQLMLPISVAVGSLADGQDGNADDPRVGVVDN